MKKNSLNSKIKILLCVIVTLTCLASCSDKKDGKYKTTDLPFKFIGLVIGKGGGITKSVEYNNGVRSEKTSCSGVTIDGLKIGDHDISLKSNTVTSDCKIETKEYGNLLISDTTGTLSFIILVTPQQERLLKKLIKK